MNTQDMINELISDEEYKNCEFFETRLNELEQDNFSIKELRELQNFASQQYGHWMANWYFSSLSNPDNDSKTQSEGWQRLSQAFLSTLVQSVPETANELQREHDLIVLRYSMQKKN